MSKVSVCIVTYNCEQDIIACLQSVIAQTYPISEIIVVDNASHDQSFELARQYAEHHSNMFVEKNETNNGFAGGQNQAIGHASGDYILVLNPDVELDSNFVAHIINQLEHNKEAGSASGLLQQKDNPNIVDSTGLHMPFNRHAVDRGMGQSVDSWLQPSYIFGPSGAAAVYKREMVEAIKIQGEFFDEQFFAYKEDVDVAWRAQNLGWTSLYVPTARGYHGRGWKKGGRDSISLFVRQNSYVNQIYMLIKNEQFDLKMIIRLPILIGREIMKLVYIILKERDLLASWKTLKKVLPSMIDKRRELLQKIRTGKKEMFQK